jgi:hypothetical protein
MACCEGIYQGDRGRNDCGQPQLLHLDDHKVETPRRDPNWELLRTCTLDYDIVLPPKFAKLRD